MHVHWLPVHYSNNMSYSSRIRAFGSFAWAAARKAASLPADLVFATSTPLTIALPGIYAANRQKVPMVFEVRDLWPELPIAIGALKNPISKYVARKLEMFAYRNSSAVVALSPGMREGVVRTGYPAERVFVIPNASDLELFNCNDCDSLLFRREHPEIGDNPLVVYTGTLGVINGLDYLARIAAAARRHGANTQFVIVGEGQCEEMVREEAERLGVLGKNFHLYPSVPKSRIRDVLAAADLALCFFVDLKPMWANSANKFFDALACGTPVAVNYGGWQAELLKESGAGLVLPSANPEEAASFIQEFLDQPQGVFEAGKAARRLAEERFSRDILADELERVLQNTVMEN